MNARNVIQAIDTDKKLMVLLGLVVLDGAVFIGLLITAGVWLVLF
ncbi:MAG: hypothetical protein NTZ34_12215 [Chloroflexi bacterium]|nr:hypothetical protein [Chloroflexota bacterium]